MLPSNLSLVTMAPQGSSPIRDAIFISYRRNDTRGSSGRLYDWLCIAFGKEKVFRDVASIGVGRWRDKIDAALAQSAVCVAVVGQRWANAENLLRLHESQDLVRHELITALGDVAITLVPTLVEDATLPSIKQLPAELQSLFEIWNARTISESGWTDDTRRLIGEIANATRLPVVATFDELLLAQQRLAAQEQQRYLQAEQIEALNRTIEELRTKLAEAPTAQRAVLTAAFAELGRGESLQAEDAFEREYKVQTLAETHGGSERANSARNVANLAVLRDVRKAALFYRHALDADPDDADTARLLGTVLITLGDLAGAQAAISDALRLAQVQKKLWTEMAARGALGDIAMAIGDLAAAMKEYESVHQLAEARASHERSDNGLQHYLSVSQFKIGEVLLAKGQGSAAFHAFCKSLTICEALVASNPTNTRWLRDSAVVREKIGDVHFANGKSPEALNAFRSSLEIREALVAFDRTNNEWQYDLAVSYIKMSDFFVAHKRNAAALAFANKGLAITGALVNLDPANTEWQRGLSAGHTKAGNLLSEQGGGKFAIDVLRKGLAIAEALVERDPANAVWQRELSVSHFEIGEALLSQDNALGALPAFRSGAAIAAALAARNSANTMWQSDLSTAHEKLAVVLAELGECASALDALRSSLSIRSALVAHDPGNVKWALSLVVSCAKLGSLSLMLSNQERRAYLERGATLLAAIKAAGRLMPNQDWTAWFADRLNELPPKN